MTDTTAHTPSRSEFIPIRGKRYHVRRWGREGAPLLVMIHGFMDMSATYQFVVDELKGDWNVVAPDWRGFGKSEPNNGTYWFSDYVADLDALLDHYSPAEPVSIVGHSMGANTVGFYAGIRPHRIKAFVNLEGLGFAQRAYARGPVRRFRKWLDELESSEQMRWYPDVAALAARLMRANHRLRADQAEFLAESFSEPVAGGGVRTAADSAHRNMRPVLVPVAEFKEVWREIAAPVLCICGEDSDVLKAFVDYPGELDARMACFPKLRTHLIADAGHNMHHDHPDQVAALIENFLANKARDCTEFGKIE
jgi:pimeloyl-ACP methyl ester carboxylesterase